MLSRCGHSPGDSRRPEIRGFVDQREVEIGRVSVFAEMHEAQRRSALEDESPAVGKGDPGELRDDVCENVVTLRHMSFDSIVIGATNDALGRDHGSRADDGAQLVDTHTPGHPKALVDPILPLVRRIETNDRTAWFEPRLQTQRQIERMTQRCEPPLRCEAPRSKGRRESVDAGRIDVLGSIGKCLGELLRAADQVQTEGRLQEGSLHRRPPGKAHLLSFEVDRIPPLDDDPQGPPAQLLDADLSQGGNADGANRMAEQTVLRERSRIRDPMVDASKGSPH